MTLSVDVVGINVGIYIYAKRLLTHQPTTPLEWKGKSKKVQFPPGDKEVLKPHFSSCGESTY